MTPTSGLVSAALALPAGPLVERRRKRPVMVLADVVRALRVQENSRYEARFWTVNVVGAPLGGLLVSALGAPASMAANALAYPATAAGIRRITRPEPEPPAVVSTGWLHDVTRDRQHLDPADGRGRLHPEAGVLPVGALLGAARGGDLCHVGIVLVSLQIPPAVTVAGAGLVLGLVVRRAARGQ